MGVKKGQAIVEQRAWQGHKWDSGSRTLFKNSMDEEMVGEAGMLFS